MKILRIDSSARYEASVSRQLGNQLLGKLKTKYPDAQIIERDVAQGLPFVDETMAAGYMTPPEERTAEQKSHMSVSDTLVEELASADMVVIGAPIYNFSVPATLKAYFDLVARVGVSFSYTSEGPKGLLRDRKTYLIVTSGGTPVGSDIDFASRYATHFLSFLGITDVEVIAADGLSRTGSEKITEVSQYIESEIV